MYLDFRLYLHRYLDNNALNGTIPSSIGSLTSLNVLCVQLNFPLRQILAAHVLLLTPFSFAALS
jgi:hypothetical protein